MEKSYTQAEKNKDKDATLMISIHLISTLQKI